MPEITGIATKASGPSRLALVVAGIIAVLVASLGVAAAATFVTSWGTRGAGHGEFFSPDTSDNRIEKFSQP